MTSTKGDQTMQTPAQQIAALDPKVAIALANMALEYVRFVKETVKS
jgi:hypothetical protein